MNNLLTIGHIYIYAIVHYSNTEILAELPI